MEGIRAGFLFFPRMVRRVYNWVIGLSGHPRAGLALFLLAFSESSFFPIPPDVLVITLGIAAPKKAFKWGAIALLGSVLGGMFGYYLGAQFMDLVGYKILALYHLQDKYLVVQDLYRRYDAWAVAAGGFTPLPYKLFTITAGAFHIDFPTFCLASLFSRGGRFFLVSGLIYVFGPSVRDFIERYFNILTFVFAILLVVGYIVIKWLI